MTGLGAALEQAAWVFYAFGPQLVVCLALAYVAARRSRGSMLQWLAGGFLAAVVPVIGVVVMAALLWRVSVQTTHADIM